MSPPATRGLQRERTALAWDRTGLALIAAGLLTVRAAGPPYVGWLPVPGYLTTLLGAGVLVHAGRRYGKDAEDTAPIAPWLTRIVGGTVTLLGAYALWLIVTS